MIPGDGDLVRAVVDAVGCSAIIVPLAARGRTLGAIELLCEREGRSYAEDDLRFAEQVAERASFAIDNARLYRDRAEIARMGGTPAAAFWLDMRPGFALSPSLEGPLVTAVSARGTHGYTPDHPEMNASFFLSGAGIKKGLDLGIVDMRAIAPTLARVMGVPFPSADQPALSVIVEASAAGR